MKQLLTLLSSITLLLMSLPNVGFGETGIQSFEMGDTILKVKLAKHNESPFIVTSGYDGEISAVRFDGRVVWRNPLSGYVNHDVCCQDIDSDGIDEILVANADGTVYCLDARGKLRWKYRPSPTPMYTLCVVKSKDSTPLIACGGFDHQIYFLSADGERVQQLDSNSYSIDKTWGNRVKPPNNRHTSNFLRPLPQADGSENLALIATNNHMQSRGTLYLFKPLEKKPYYKKAIPKFKQKVIGDVSIADVDGDGAAEILFGTSSGTWGNGCAVFYPAEKKWQDFSIDQFNKKYDGFGYRVTQPRLVEIDGQKKHLIMFGSRMFLTPLDFNAKDTEILACKYSFNDACIAGEKSMLVLASAQSGGSCIHLVDLSSEGWKQAYKQLVPPGNITKILENSRAARLAVKSFEKPAWENSQRVVEFLSDRVDKNTREISKSYPSPVFLNGIWNFELQLPESWDRDQLAHRKWREARDRRMKYTLTGEQVLERMGKKYRGYPGIATWGGHGNDPFFYSPEVTRKLIDIADGKRTVLIYPEMEVQGEDAEFLLDELLVPLARHAQGRNGTIFLRNKHVFWLGNIYQPHWRRLITGEFADVITPSMEETTDKSMELSLAARMGLWASGAFDNWGSRLARDNPSYDRSREFSHQMLPNHFLRNQLLHFALGATQADNFEVDNRYMSLLWWMIAKGALYVPQRDEIVSFSPVHLSIAEPDQKFVEHASAVKWTTFYDPELETPMVFSRLNGTWPGAPNTQWDFSRYAAGSVDRRLNFLPTYPHGMVLITPPQDGKFADADAPRGKLANRLHPMYRDIMQEFLTDGRQYLSSDGNEKYPADEYFSTVQSAIEKARQKLPVVVSGDDVAWVVAQTDPHHLRLTLIDGGYLNPRDRVAKVTLQTVQAKKITDLLNDQEIQLGDDSSAQIDVPCGLFRFIDIELTEPFYDQP